MAVLGLDVLQPLECLNQCFTLRRLLLWEEQCGRDFVTVRFGVMDLGWYICMQAAPWDNAVLLIHFPHTTRSLTYFQVLVWLPYSFLLRFHTSTFILLLLFSLVEFYHITSRSCWSLREYTIHCLVGLSAPF